MGQRNVKRKLVSATARPQTAHTVHDGDWDFLYQTAPVGLAIFDNELRFLRVNEAFARIDGVPITLHLREYVRDIVPGLAPALEPLLREVLDTGEPISDREVYGKTPAAPEERSWLASFQPLLRGPLVYGVSCAMQEITEVRRAQQTLALTQHSIDHASDEIMWLDPTGRFVYVNQTACRRLEYSLGELLQMNVRDIVPDQPSGRYAQVWAEMHESASMSFESRHRSKSGRVFPVEVTVNLVEFQGSEYCFAVVHDNSARKEAEALNQLVLSKARRLQSKLVEIATDQELWNSGVSEAVSRIDEIVAKSLEVGRASVWLLDREGKALRALDVFDRRHGSHTSGILLSLENSPEYLKAAREGRVIAASDVFKDPWTASLAEGFFRPLDIYSVVNAPVRVAGKVAALLCVGQTGSAHEWTPEEINFVAEVADQVAHAMLNAERQQTERMIQRLAEDAANKTGHEFFRSIVGSLAEVLEADFALVAEVLPPDQQRMRTLVRLVDGKESPNFEEYLAATPCINVISGGACSYPSNVQEQFPHDTRLVQAGAQAFFGTPLVSSAGKPLGFLAVLYRRAIENVSLVEAGLAAFASRASAEMERLQNEESLRRSDERYRAFVANAQESIWRMEFEPPVPVDLPEEEMMERIMDAGYLAETSDYGARMRGFKEAGDIVGMNLRKLISYEAKNTDTIRMLIRNNFRLDADIFPIVHADGSTRHVYRTGFGVVENGLLRRVWGTGLDVTDLIRAQAERQQTERMIQRLGQDAENKTGHEFFRSIVSNLADVLEADMAFVAEVIPPDQQRMRSLAWWRDGREAPNFEVDLLGTPSGNVVSGGACSYPSRVQEQFPQDAALLQAAAQAYFATPLISSAGKYFGVLAVLYRREVEDVRLVEAGLAAFAARASAEIERLQNEESLRRSDERYKAFVANAHESIWRVEFEPPVPADLPEDELFACFLANGYIADCNNASARLHGFARAEDMAGMRFEEMLRMDAEGFTGLRVFIRNKLRALGRIITVRDPSGNAQFVYWNGFAVLEGGLVRRIWGTGQDVTDVMRAQEEIRQLNATLEDQVASRTAELRATVEELEAFSHSISHDLRAPLLGIAGCSRALLEDYSDGLEAGALDWIKLIQRDAEHLDRLLNSLLGLSRITRAELFRQPVDLTAMAQSVTSALQQAEPQRKVTPVIAEGMIARGDQTLLRVAMENLIGNAWKFSRGRMESRIEVGEATVNGAPAFYVRDNGVGFDQRYASRLFAAFERLHTGEFQGTGIGLATVRRIIHRHGGRAWAEGAVEQGATFYFTLAGREESRA